MNKVLYISPLTGNMKYMIDAEGVKYHAQRDQAVLKIRELAKDNKRRSKFEIDIEMNKQFYVIQRALRMIKKNGYYSTPVIE